MAYTSDLTDKQYEYILKVVPELQTQEISVSKKRILNGINYQLKNGCQWRDLPKDFPNWNTVYSQFRRWKNKKIYDKLLIELEKLERTSKGKKSIPSLLLGDSMAVKNTDTADIETKGFCHYKCTNGIKRHLLVDTLGNPYFVKCTKASISDDDGLIEIIKENKDFFLNLENGHIITILLDNGYHKDNLEKKIKEIDEKILEHIRIEITEKISPDIKEKAKIENPSKNGFVVQAKRWIVERTNAWVNQCRVLWKNCEGKLSTSEAKIRLCSIRLILRRIVN